MMMRCMEKEVGESICEEGSLVSGRPSGKRSPMMGGMPNPRRSSSYYAQPPDLNRRHVKASSTPRMMAVGWITKWKKRRN
jgi:hypothetical protein